MAEFLVLRQNYWTGKESEAIAKMGDAKYQAGVHRPWDIIEVQEDSFYLSTDNPVGRGWNQEAFYMIQVIGISKFDALQYVESFMNGEITVKRHKWHTPNIPNNIKNILERDRTRKTTWAWLQSQLVEKTS